MSEFVKWTTNETCSKIDNGQVAREKHSNTILDIKLTLIFLALTYIVMTDPYDIAKYSILDLLSK